MHDIVGFWQCHYHAYNRIPCMLLLLCNLNGLCTHHIDRALLIKGYLQTYYHVMVCISKQSADTRYLWWTVPQTHKQGPWMRYSGSKVRTIHSYAREVTFWCFLKWMVWTLSHIALHTLYNRRRRVIILLHTYCYCTLTDTHRHTETRCSIIMTPKSTERPYERCVQHVCACQHP